MFCEKSMQRVWKEVHYEKRILGILLGATLSVLLCACGEKESGSTENQTTENESTSQINKNLTYDDLTNMSVEEMKQYYNADELVGTPMMEMHYVNSKGKDAETFRVSRELYDDNGNAYYEKEYHIENTIGLSECLCNYYCIFVDNNTPDNYEDDQFAFVFYWVYK